MTTSEEKFMTQNSEKNVEGEGVKRGPASERPRA
jgi:hypothetical protein